MIVRSEAPLTYLPEFKSISKPSIIGLDNGISISSFNNGDQDVFRIELIFRIGSADFDNLALSEALLKLLREGTRHKSAEEINDLLDYYGSFLDLSSGLDHSTVTLFGRSEFIHILIPLLSEIVLQPGFTEKGLLKHKELSIQTLQIGQKKTSYWSSRLLRKAIYGEIHPYSRIPSIQNIAEIERDSLAKAHLRLLESLDHVIIAGSFPQDKMESLIRESFSGLTRKSSLNIHSSGHYLPQKIEQRIDKANQASIALGFPSISIKDGQYPIYSFLIKILGGYFGSRLMKSLREEAGLTYGVHGYLLHLLQGSSLQITSDVKLEAIDESIDIVLHEIKQLLDNPIAADEINTVQSYMLGEYVNDSNTAFDFATLYKKIILQDLPENFYDSFYKQISSITPEILEELKCDVLNPERLSIIKVY